MKLVLILSVIVYVIGEVTSQKFILPTYRPPPKSKRPVIIRARRDVNNEPLWLWKDETIKAPATGEHPYLPPYIDDIKLDPHTRTARSLSTPNHGPARGSSSKSSSRNTGATHPGYNRRNTRDLHIPGIPKSWPTLPPFNPKPRYPWDNEPKSFPIYV